MDSKKYIGMDVRKESISIAVMSRRPNRYANQLFQVENYVLNV